MADLSREQALSIIGSKKIVQGTDKFKMKVTNVTAFHQERAIGANVTHIVNFDSMSEWHDKEAEKAFNQGDYNKAAGFGYSFNVREGEYIPQKNELVEVQLNLVELSGEYEGEKGYFVNGVFKIEAKEVVARKRAWLDGSKNSAEVISEETPAFADANA